MYISIVVSQYCSATKISRGYYGGCTRAYRPNTRRRSRHIPFCRGLGLSEKQVGLRYAAKFAQTLEPSAICSSVSMRRQSSSSAVLFGVYMNCFA